MSLIKDIELQITAYDKLIEDLVDKNASDRVIGDLELKRIKLLKRKKTIEKQKKQNISVKDGDKDKEIIMLRKQCEMLYDVAQALLEVTHCHKCEYDVTGDQAYYIDELSKDKYDGIDLLDELNLI